jgi:hypothetical protein
MVCLSRLLKFFVFPLVCIDADNLSKTFKYYREQIEQLTSRCQEEQLQHQNANSAETDATKLTIVEPWMKEWHEDRRVLTERVEMLKKDKDLLKVECEETMRKWKESFDEERRQNLELRKKLQVVASLLKDGI